MEFKQDMEGRTKIGFLNVIQSQRLDALMLEYNIQNPRHFINLLVEDKYKSVFHPNARLTLKEEVI